MKINSCMAFAVLLLLLLVSCALALETTTQEAKGARDEVEPADHRGGSGGCKGGNCGGSGGCKGGHCGGSGGCKGSHCGGGGGLHCYHGCCKYYGGKCKNCCPSAEAARAFAEKQAHP